MPLTGGDKRPARDSRSCRRGRQEQGSASSDARFNLLRRVFRVSVPKRRFRIAQARKRQELFDLAICFGLILSIFAVYSQVGGFDFVNYDDGESVYQNVHVQAGLTPASVKWALTAVVVNNWMPVTLLSHILVGQLFGMRSGMHHLVNVLFHAMAAVLLFASLRRATGARGMSAFVAFMFALHPLHVESVAWVTERKDVLSAFFWFLGLYEYVLYSERPSLGRYLAVATAFCLGLMSKPMLVTFPFTLLLFDVWPLRRTQWPSTIWEKLPLIALSAGASAATWFFQGSARALLTIPLATRIENAFISCLTYIGQMFYPVRLAVFYPYPPSIPLWKAASACAAVLTVSVLVIRAWRTRPYLMMGWFWYLGTLVPVIGLVQAGRQAHADRYMYIPMVGLSVMLAWGAADVFGKWPRTKSVAAVAGAAFCAACMALAWKETAHWRNSETLYEHAIDATGHNDLAEYNLGTYLATMQRYTDAIPHFEAALSINPDFAEAHDNLGTALASRGDCAAAIPHFEAAIRATPNYARASYNLGSCQMVFGNYAAAIPYFEAAVRADAGFADAYFRLAVSLSKVSGRAPDAIRQYETVLRLRPDDGRAHAELGRLLAGLGRVREAITHLEAAQNIDPDPVVSKLLDELRAGQQ